MGGKKMMHLSKQSAVLAMREQQLSHVARPAFGAYNTGSSISAPDAPTYAFAILKLNIPGSHNTSTSASVVMATKLDRVLPLHTVEQAPLRPSDIVAFVRRVFGLNVSEAAQVFGVRRPTIYLWSGLQDMGLVRQGNQVRMKYLYSLARKWEELGPLPVGSLGAVLPDFGATLLELLSADVINRTQLLQAHDRLTAMGSAFRLQEHEKAMEAVRGLKGAFSAMAANQGVRKKS
jgi:hypothetical protein